MKRVIGSGQLLNSGHDGNGKVEVKCDMLHKVDARKKKVNCTQTNTSDSERRSRPFRRAAFAAYHVILLRSSSWLLLLLLRLLRMFASRATYVKSLGRRKLDTKLLQAIKQGSQIGGDLFTVHLLFTNTQFLAGNDGV